MPVLTVGTDARVISDAGGGCVSIDVLGNHATCGSLVGIHHAHISVTDWLNSNHAIIPNGGAVRLANPRC